MLRAGKLAEKSRAKSLIEALEPRTLLTAFVVFDGSATVLGTIAGKNVRLPSESAALGPAIEATINWGDGSSSDATLERLANGRLEVIAGHAYAATKTYHVTITTSASGVTKTALKTTASVQLNATRGRTINTTVGEGFSGTVGTLQRLKPLPKIMSPMPSLGLPAGAEFGQYTVGSGGATATFRIDWGDGTVTDGSIVSNSNGNYNVLGSHNYVAAGAYRVITNVIISAADGTVLHVDQVDSTAHAKSPIGHHTPFALPSHVDVDWSQILPPAPGSGDAGSSGGAGGSTPSGGAGGSIDYVGGGSSSGGATGGVLNFGGNGGGGSLTGSGTLVLSGGSGLDGRGGQSGSGSITIIGNSTLSSGGAVGTGTLVLGPGSVNLLTGSTTSASGSIVLTGTTSTPTLILTANFDPSQSANVTGTQINLYLTGNALTDPATARLLGQTSWVFHADGAISIAATNGVVSIANPLTLLAHLTGGTISFDSDVTSAQIMAAAGALPSDFVGTVTLPFYMGDLVTWPTGATVTQPPAPPPIDLPVNPSPDPATT